MPAPCNRAPINLRDGGSTKASDCVICFDYSTYKVIYVWGDAGATPVVDAHQLGVTIEPDTPLLRVFLSYCGGVCA